MNEPIVIEWYRAWHSLKAAMHDTLDDAVMSAMGRIDYETGSPEYIEVIEDGTSTYCDMDYIFRRSTEIEAARPQHTPAPIVARIDLLDPKSNEWGEYGIYCNPDDAREDAQALAVLGRRVRLTGN